MNTNATCAFAMLIGVTACASVRGSDTDSVNTDLTPVEEFGAWEAGAQSGRFRTEVVTGCSPEHCSDSVYLEWLVSTVGMDGEGSSQRLLGRVGIEEVGAAAHVQRVTWVPDSSTPSRFEIVIDHGSPTVETRILCIAPTVPGAYSSSEGPCGQT